MRAVIDTNILIRALIKPDGTVGPVLARLADGEYTLVYSDPLIDELLEKLALPRIRNKYSIDDDVVEGFLQLIALRGEHVIPHCVVQLGHDPDDDRVIEAALDGSAEYIVSGDSDLLILDRVGDVRIIPPARFIGILDNAGSGE
ncbi:MAG: putative toxin-antitoxin system toxin component, PIN family [Chloroflexi bacterium]|nr:putative toxin-antitoxin system toxin component, PIN family [Chloroflexota bacterium]MCL5274670.1 putative toxin-antitoxin system toxin component, PIN family [Chloroflexota bacterium]